MFSSRAKYAAAAVSCLEQAHETTTLPAFARVLSAYAKDSPDHGLTINPWQIWSLIHEKVLNPYLSWLLVIDTSLRVTSKSIREFNLEEPNLMDYEIS